MRRRGLKFLRVAGAGLMFAGLTAALVDFRGAGPPWVGHRLAAMQFVPSAMALATGAAIGGASLVILVATLAVGRIYCSVLCPLGVLQDLFARLAGWVRRGRPRWPFRPAQTWVRAGFFGAVVVGVAGGWVGFTLTLLDPYSIFGRIASGMFRPAVTLVNNALVGATGPWGGESLYRVSPQWAGAGALAVPAALLILVAGLAIARGRLYCNTVCPVGTLLGFLSARSALRLALDPAACRKCGDCLRVCKAQCIDLRSGVIDHSRCVACYNCVDVCREEGIRHRWSWRREPRPARPPEPDPNPPAAVDRPRRRFIAGAAAAVLAAGGLRPANVREPRASSQTTGEDPPGGHRRKNYSRVICPPGAGSIDRFLEQCTACHLCISACPTHVLQPAFLEYGLAGLMKPRLDYTGAFCNFDCQRCAEVCPDGAITLRALEEKHVTRIGVAGLELERCIVKTKGTDCAACSEHCPTKAVDTVPFGDNLRLPQVNQDLCIGCGACEYACPALPQKAITVTGLRRHEQARRQVEEKARDPRAQADFPF